MLAKIINKYKEIKKLKETRTEVVCKCFGLTNYDLRDAVNNGCEGIKEVKANTKAGTGCGRCNASVKRHVYKAIKNRNNNKSSKI